MAIKLDAPNESDEQQRRYLTILFCDLVGFTQLSERLDPEELRDVQSEYQRITVTVMERYGGFVASFSGDGVSVYFGYPVAHENDAERAVRASLELIERLREADIKVGHERIPLPAVRIGAHTGLVVIGPEHASAGQKLQSAVGEAVNLAARLQLEAPANSIVVTGETLELLKGAFETEPLGTKSLKGLSRIIPLHRVSRARPAQHRMRGHLQRGSAHVVGRASELERIISHWGGVLRNRRCRTVFVVGEAGIGKTRMVVEFCRRAELNKANILQVNCQEIFANTPFYPISSLLWSCIGPGGEDDRTVEIQNLSAFLDQIGINSSDNIEIVASLLGLALTSKMDEIARTPLLVRKRQFAFLIALIEKLSRRHPILLWIDDAHWLDPSSAELLREIVDHLARAPILILLTLRSFPAGPALPAPDNVVHLEPLAQEECLELARAVPGGQILSDQLLAYVVDVADGIPLFVEQLVRSLVDQGANALMIDRVSRRVPLTLAELLSEQLDRLSGGRRIVQVAACLGRSFTPDFLALLLRTTATRILEPLQALVGAEILRLGEDGTEPYYEFRHALLQRVAYESMLQAERRAVHADIVRALNEGAVATPVVEEVIAHHLTAAGLFLDGIRTWLSAGVTAARRSAHIEAIEHLRRGLGLLGEIAEPAVRRELEVNLQAALIGSITATQGSTSNKLAEACQRGVELCGDGDPMPLIFPFLFGQFTFAICRGNTGEAGELARLFLATAERGSDEAGRVIGHRLLGMALLGEGNATSATQQLKHSLRLYSRERDTAATHLFGQDAEVHGRSLLSLSLFCLGEVEEALHVGRQALQTADRLRHPHSMAIALAYVGGWVAGLCGARDVLLREASRLIEISEQHRLGVFRAFGTAFWGWAACQAGDLDKGIAALQQAIETFDTVDYRLSIPGHLANLADAMRQTGRLEKAQTLCARACQMISDGGDRWLEPEVRRVQAMVVSDIRMQGSIKGELLHRGALECARKLSFPVFELRCLLSLREFLKDYQYDAELDSRITELSGFGDLAHRAAEALRTSKPCN